MNAFSKQAKWIGRTGGGLGNWRSKPFPAPFLRKVFTCAKTGGRAIVNLSGIGYSELYVNGAKVGEGVLDPVVTHYDKRVLYISYDVTGLLREGSNVLGVILGNGWYNCHTQEEGWHFEKASWRDNPKMLLQLEIDGMPVVQSDRSWKLSSGPIVFDALRLGETYDARLELDGWLSPDYNDSSWTFAGIIPAPGGVLDRQRMPSCKVTSTIPPAEKWALPNGDTVYDFGVNIAGWSRLAASGEAGSEIVLSYGERLGKDRGVDQSHIGKHVGVNPGQFQTDRYILKGAGLETWEARFTYHGFQYVQVSCKGKASVAKLEARIVHTAFEKTGSFSSSDETLNRLHDCTIRSYVGNFVAVPTDCPHREKNGWTGDAQLAAETGLFNFDSASSYSQWMDSFADVQRPSGQLPGIIPSSGWGFNWGSGPAWDSAFILIPWYIYLYTGDSSTIKANYDGMRRYVDYCFAMSEDDIVFFGLGDWCHVDRSRIVDVSLTSTAYYYVDTLLLSRFATLCGRFGDAADYAAAAASIRMAFNARFYKGDGIYAKGEQTALACRDCKRRILQGRLRNPWREICPARPRRERPCGAGVQDHHAA